MKTNQSIARLLRKSAPIPQNQVLELPVDRIIANNNQPRRDFAVDSLIQLADSIRRYGILQPLTVRSAPEGQYQLIAGERRLRAAKMLGMKTVPCLLRETSDSDSAELALIENTIRQNLGMFETALAFSVLSEKFRMTQEEIAEKMSLSQSAVANKMRLLRFSEAERESICQAGLTERHARALLRLQNKNMRESALQYMINHNLNVTESEDYVSSILMGKPLPLPEKRPASEKTPLSVCQAVGKYMDKLQSSCGFVNVQTKEQEDETIITLHIKKQSAS